MSKEAMQLALEALETGGWNKTTAAITALRERLAKPEQTISMTEYKRLQDLVTSQGIRLMEYESAHPKQEPFCYHDGRNIVGKEFADHSDVFPLYTSPQPAQQQCWKCGDMDAAFQAKCKVPACGMKEQPAQQQEPVATVVKRQYEDGTYAGNALDWAGRNCEDDFPVGTKLYTDPQIDQLIRERDHRDEIIDKLCDAVLGPDRYEWSSQYFFEDAVREVEERMAELEQQQQEPVAYLCDGSRYKVLGEDRSGYGRILGLPESLAGQWVALVDATDGKHLRAEPARTKDLTDIEYLQDAVTKALKKAFHLGQTYWQQADSESYAANKKADATQELFFKLKDDTRAVIIKAGGEL